MNRCDTFLMPVPGQKCDHLWIVISDPNKHEGTFIIMNATTSIARAGTDCVLDAGDHPFIVETCYITFGDALEITTNLAANIETLIERKKIGVHEPLAEELVNKVVAAALTSKAFPVRFRKYL